jgi:hypothetical protein
MKYRYPALIAALCVGCSARQDLGGDADGGAVDGASVTGLDGTWDITFSHYAYYTSGTLLVTGNTAEVKLTGVQQGSSLQTGCTYTTAEDDVQLAASPGLVQGVSTHLQQVDGAGCPGNSNPGVLERYDPDGTYLASRSTTESSAFGSLGGGWAVGGPRTGCQVTLSGTALSATCSDGTSFDGTLAGDDLSGQTNAGSEFAAHRH